MCKHFTKYVVGIALFTLAFFGTGVNAETPTDAYDAVAYTEFMESNLKDLHHLYLKAVDKNSPQGIAEQARQAYIAKTRDVLFKMNTRFDNMEIKQGASLSNTEMLINTHIVTMLVDMLAAEHQPHQDKWSYTD